MVQNFFGPYNNKNGTNIFFLVPNTKNNGFMKIKITPENGEKNLLALLRKKGYPLSAPCGGNGRCGKCKVVLNGKTVLACRTEIDGEAEAEIPEGNVLSETDLTETRAFGKSGGVFCK